MTSRYSSEELDNVYHALANSTRRKILTRLAKEGPVAVSQLAEPFEMSLAAVSKHIKVLEKANLIRKERDATTLYCVADLGPIESASALIHFLDKHRAAKEPVPA